MKAHLAGCFLVTVLVLFACVHFAVAGAKLKLQVQARQSLTPIGEWHLRIWCPKDPANRILRVEAHGDDYDRATEIQLDGEKAPGIHEVWWKGRVPCGDYAIAASVWTNQGTHEAAVEHATICVTPPDPQP